MVVGAVGARFSDRESQRQRKNSSDRQIKNYHQTKEGVIVNTIIKDSVNSNRNDLLHDYIVPSNSKMPDKDLSQKPYQEKNNSLKFLCGMTLGIAGAVAGVAKLVNKVAEKKIKKPNFESLPDIGRNMNLNRESHFVTYMTVQNPQTKTILGAAAFFTFVATAFVMKNFVDGFKETWVKKENLAADYKLQDNLINVETKIFKGKNEIIRSMMNDTAKKMQKQIDGKTDVKKQNFKGSLSFGKTEDKKSEKQKDKNNLLLGLGTLAATVALGAFAFKNVKKTGKLIEKNYDDTHKQVQKILEKTPEEITEKHKDTLKDLFSILNFKPQEVEKHLQKANLPKEEIEEVVETVSARTKRFSQSPKEIGGHVGKVQYFTYIDDANGHFYNWMMNMDSKPLGILAMSMSGIGAIGYMGQKAVEAVRDVEVKKVNNDAELNYHKNLINVELRNFKRKKESYIKPLVSEFEKEVPKKDKKELQDMAQNVLYEIKNGPPFVYS